jgi:hypothetical protein
MRARNGVAKVSRFAGRRKSRSTARQIGPRSARQAKRRPAPARLCRRGADNGVGGDNSAKTLTISLALDHRANLLATGEKVTPRVALSSGRNPTRHHRPSGWA